MYIVYSMIICHVLKKVFSLNSGVMLSSSFSDALLFENVFVIRLNIRARLVSLLGPTSQKQRLVCLLFGLNGPLRQYFTLYQAVSQREGERKEKSKRREKCPNNRPPAPTACAVGPCPALICL